jgi:[protein-PII] uridylyltransferase
VPLSRHLEQVLAHAENQLAATGAKRPTEVLPLYQKFLKIEEHRLRLKHQAGGGGREICGRRADLVDVLLKHVFTAAGAAADRDGNVQPTQLALIAIGGYGRGELNPFSDIDVMLLHRQRPKKITPYIEGMVEQLLYLLWDSGFKVGHSTRSIKEAIAQANRDMLTKTAMLEARFLAGNADLANEFRRQFLAKCVVGYEREYIQARMDDQIARHKKFGDSVYMQEPHIKNGCGALRDYQNLLWITYFKEGELTTNRLVGKDWLSRADQRQIESAYDFLLRVRTDLHYLTGRASDLLHLNLQEQIARRLGYLQKNGQLRSEAFMRDYYEHARNVFRVTERITHQFATGHVSEGTRSLFHFLPLMRTKEQRLGEFFVRDKQLYPDRRDLFRKQPAQLMRVFQVAQEHALDLSPDLADLLSRSLGQVNRTFQYAKEPREMFKSILSRKGEVASILRMMHRIDFLGRYLPEFGQLTCLVQHEFLHRYTADEHTLVCIDKLDALVTVAHPKLVPYRKVFEQLEDSFVLYLALLLHDTGKAVGARPHAEASAVFAQRVANRLLLTSEQRKSLILLVDHHLTLSSMAQQRNLEDPATISEFADIVKSRRNLDALMLLTLADGQGTSAEAWSDWKESLVWHLYDATSQYLDDRKAYYEKTRIERDRLQASVFQKLSADYADEIEAHFELMPDDYFRGAEIVDLVDDINVIRTFLRKASEENEESLAPVMMWQAAPERGHSIVTVCTWERQRLLAKIAGSFSVVPLNILSADVFTRSDNIVLEIFRVCDTKGRAVADSDDIDLVEKTLRSALEAEQFDFGPLLEKARHTSRRRLPAEEQFPTRISVDNKAHAHYTLIQIETPDRLGLLYDLLSCLHREGVSIALSRISTQAGAAIDTFYVVDGGTRSKITDSVRIAELQKQLQIATLGTGGSSSVTDTNQ